jgi:hypothetical protein
MRAGRRKGGSKASTAILLAAAAAAALAAVVLAAVLFPRPPEIKESWKIYVQSLSPQSKILAKGANPLTNTVFRLKEEAAKMEAELSADLMRQAKATLSDPEIRRGIAKGLEGVVSSFCVSALKLKPSTIAVVLGE